MSWGTFFLQRCKENKGKGPRRHTWVNLGVADNSFGRAFGDEMLSCSECGEEFTYAAVDHDCFERHDRESECPGSGVKV